MLKAAPGQLFFYLIKLSHFNIKTHRNPVNLFIFFIKITERRANLLLYNASIFGK